MDLEKCTKCESNKSKITIKFGENNIKVFQKCRNCEVLPVYEASKSFFVIWDKENSDSYEIFEPTDYYVILN